MAYNIALTLQITIKITPFFRHKTFSWFNVFFFCFFNDSRDRGWMLKDRRSREYEEGVFTSLILHYNIVKIQASSVVHV